MAPPNASNVVNLGAPKYAAPASLGAPALPPPNPQLGERMRQRDWTGREQQSYYEMGQAPLPTQYTNDKPHPVYGGGANNPVEQYLPPIPPPTGFDARRRPVTYSNPGVAPHPGRPSYAFNRVAGRGPAPTMYTTTWPSQYYPGGSNTFIPSWEATGLLVSYTRDQANFRINKYLKTIKVSKQQAYYLTLSGDDPYRVVSVNDYLWADSTDAPGGRQERQGFGFVPYQTARYCYPFSLGKLSVDQADWPILANHSRMQMAKAMTVRTMLNTTLATTAANWTGTWGTNTSAVSGAWTTSPLANNYIQTDINTAMIAIEQASGGIVTDEEALTITMNPVEARGVAKSPEYKTYIQGSPDALAAITDQRNPNRRYGMAPYLYGLGLVVENAVRVTTPKSGNVPSPPSQTRSYVWGQSNIVIASKPAGLTGSEGDQTLDFSTFAGRFYEEMTVESKTDSDNRREIGRIVENFILVLQAPQTGYLLTGAS